MNTLIVFYRKSTLAGLVCLLGNFGVGQAEEDSDWLFEQWGTISFENRLFLENSADPRQENNNLSLTAQPTLYWEAVDGSSFTFAPFLRFDGTDKERTHWDIREAYYLTFGSFGETDWELRLGIDQVFWGTAESNNPVNIINQTDLVEHPDGKSKLGQPMVHGTLVGGWGILDVFVLPYHRPRTFPGAKGRLRTLIPVATSKNQITYTASSGRSNIDLAARYSNSLGVLDFGVSVFDGTSREPQLELNETGMLVQHYDLVKQVGLDVQLTFDALLGKAEIVHRKETDINNQKTSHNVLVVGGEYTIYGVFESDADLTLFAELNRDSRGKNASLLQNDLFLATRVSFNDFLNTDLTVALIDDLDFDTRTLNLEFNRLLTDTVSLKLEAFKFLQTDELDEISNHISKDDFIGFNLSYSY